MPTDRIIGIAVKAAIILACLAFVRFVFVYSKPCHGNEVNYYTGVCY